MSYPDSVRYLYALGNELKVGGKFGLERMRAFLAGLGNPERRRRFIHVAGTNGKGSTSAMLASCLKTAGYRTGLYTSPHLIEPTERIQINGAPVTPGEFTAAFETVHRIAEEMLEAETLDAHPSYFETVTAMALMVFRDQTDISVMEVGLGGRLDATNVISPELCVITPVDYDHETFLGKTLESIAFEKAGILKPGLPAIFAKQRPEARAVLLQRATELQCDVQWSEESVPESIEIFATGCRFALAGVRYECPLAGKHQMENAITAIVSAQKLGLSTDAIQQGIATVQWPGRLEYVARHPDLILDGAHNPAGAKALAEYIRAFCKGRPVWIVYGAMRDKAIDEVTNQLFPLADKLILTAPDFPRALRPEALLEMSNHPNAVTMPTVGEAITLSRSAPEGAAVFFTGSLFLVGEARAAFQQGIA